MPKQECFLCLREESSLCSRCMLVFSCSKHLNLHYHQEICFPWRIQTFPEVGRIVVATRDLEAKELVLHDLPFGLSPVQDSEPVCLECFKLLDSDTWLECACGFPMCSQACCRGVRHQPECSLYQAAKVKMKTFTEYQTIMPIRMITQLEQDPPLQTRFDDLMDHQEERMEEKRNWELAMKHVVQPIRINLNQITWTEELIQRCIGVTRTNGNIRKASGFKGGDILEDSDMGNARVIYLSMTAMSNSCFPNCICSHNPDYSLTIRTIRPVEIGEELTISYAPFFAGRLERQQDFLKNWFFNCSCIRCRDVTDLGSHFDTHLCADCGGNVLPIELNDKSLWICEDCRQVFKSEDICKEESDLQLLLETVPIHDPVSFYETFLKENVKKLHQGHNIIMKAKCKLLLSFENPKGRVEIERKCELCHSLLGLMDKIIPGLTEIRGKIIYELIAPSFLLLQMNLNEGFIRKDEYIGSLKGLTSLIKECINCLEGELDGSAGFYLKKKSLQVLNNIKDMIIFTEFLD